YSVDAVYDGEDALSYVQAENYDAVILDIMLPKIDGITVLKEMRAGGNHIPVILLTAKSEIDDRVQGLDCGADDYLTKPFDTKELLARLRAITRRKDEVADTVLHFANFTLNRKNFLLSSDTETIRLANKEFQMLEMLMANPGSLISTQRFMEKIWGYDSATEINVVWVYISYLRKKLIEIGAKAQIKASRNIGYSLEELV
ncbi:MAG: response regulator transcription factor, partial [Clostridia bacterium]